MLMYTPNQQNRLTMYRPTSSEEGTIDMPKKKRSAVRLFQRRMIVVTVLVLLCLAVFGIVLSVIGDDQVQAAPIETPVVLLVKPGDSLWSIASEYRGEEPIVSYVAKLKKANGMRTSELQAGQQLKLP